jgi:hypothetical protein
MNDNFQHAFPPKRERRDELILSVFCVRREEIRLGWNLCESCNFIKHLLQFWYHFSHA